MARILIVEDDTLIKRMYQQAFEFDGFKVDLASDGEDGLSKLKDNKPTVILLDIMMPKMNGLQFLEEIKSDPVNKNIPVVVLTNLSGTQDAQKALELGAVKYIVKSQYKPKQVVNMVKEIIAAYTRDD